MSKLAKRSRGWCFTFFNYTDDHERLLDDIDCVYMIYGHEICPSTGKPHLQGAIYVKNAKTGHAMLKMLGPSFKGIHIEATKGSPTQNQKYCSKEARDVKERGEKPVCGKRTDVLTVRERLREGSSLEDIIDAEGYNYQNIRLAEKWLTYCERQRDWKPEVVWIYGPAGHGKTVTARQMLCDNVYVCTETAQWWDGYDAHKDVLLDDIRGDFAKFHVLLRILDRYPYRVAVKGGFRQFLAERIVITSCFSPYDMYEGRTDEDLGQLIRRIDMVVWCEEMEEPPILYESYYDVGERRFTLRKI